MLGQCAHSLPVAQECSVPRLRRSALARFQTVASPARRPGQQACARGDGSSWTARARCRCTRVAPLVARAAAQEETQASPASLSSSEEELRPPKPVAVPPEWENAQQLQRDGTTYRTVIRSVNRGGALVDVGPLRGFVPLSKMDPARLPRIAQNGANGGGGGGGNGLMLKDLAHLVGKPIAAKVIEVNALEGRLVLSERAAMLETVAAALNPGDVVEGVVSRLADYGAFVSLRSPDGNMHGVEGLIHISELSWSMVLTPDAVVQPGSAVRCKVKRVDRERGQIQLSLKDMEHDPLRETLDGLLCSDAADAPEAANAPVPAAIESVCRALAEESGVSDVRLGRQVEEKRAVSQDLELWIGREGVQGGYNVLARAGRLVQEILVVTSLDADAMKATIQRVLRKLV